MAIAVLTSVFNCVKNSVRHRHYNTFKENLGDLPLFTVELAFDDLPFVLEPDKNVLQIRCNTWIWQRDRIVNKLLETIPEKYNNIALVDADILFHKPTWYKDAEGMLRECQVGQVWENCHHTQNNVAPDKGISNRDKGIVHTGYAWAARRSFLEKHGLFDYSPVGGNDVMMTCAYCGWPQHPHLGRYTETFLKFYYNWAKNVYDDTHGEVGYVETDITHLWHGPKSDRNYMGRIALMKDYDPATDLKISDNGCWEWATDKPDMHEGIKTYMKTRIKG